MHIRRAPTGLTLSLLLGVFAVSAANADTPATQPTVAVPNLTVQERLSALEQINVTAFKPAQAQEPSTPSVEALLEEADAVDENAKRAESEAE